MIVAREKAEYYGLPEMPQQKRRPRSHTTKRRLVRREKLALTGLVLLLFITCAMIAFYYAQVLATGYQLNKAKSELALLRKESHYLYTEVNQLSSLKNIEYIAINELGMVKPQNDNIVTVNKTEPAAQTENAVAAAAEKETKKQSLGAASENQREQNWVIRAFTDMVGRLEASIHAG